MEHFITKQKKEIKTGFGKMVFLSSEIKNMKLILGFRMKIYFHKFIPEKSIDISKINNCIGF